MMKKESILKLTALSGVPLIMVLGNSMLIPVFPEMQRAMDITKLQAGLTITLFSLPAGLAIPLMGFLSDKIGRKKIIVPSLIVYGLGGLICGLAPTLFGKSYAVLLTGRILQGIGAAGTAPIAMALVSDIFTSNERSKALGIIEAANGMGKVISPILGSLIALLIWYALFFVYAILAVPIAIAVWLLIKEPPLEAKNESVGQYFQRITKIFKNKGISLAGCYLAGSVVLLVLFGILSYLSDMLEEEYGLTGVVKGLALAVPVLAMASTSFISGRYLQKQQKKMKFFIILGLLLVAGSMFSVSLFKYNKVFFISVFLMGIGTGLVLPAVNTLVTSSCKLKERGGITALYGSVRFFGVAAGPPTFSLLLNYSQILMFLSGGILAAIALTVAFFTINEQEILEGSREKASANAGAFQGDKIAWQAEFMGAIKHRLKKDPLK